MGGRHRPPSRWLVRRGPGTTGLLVAGLAIGVTLLAVPILGLSDPPGDEDTRAGSTGGSLPRQGDAGLGLTDPGALASTPSRRSGDPTSPPTATPDPSATALPSVDPTPTPSVSATPRSTPTPSPEQSTSSPPSGPVLLGPSSGGGVSAMAEDYCDRHVSSSSSAATRSDGRWECRRFLAPSRIVDMNVACSDTYGAGAYAQNPGGGAFGWRCYR